MLRALHDARPLHTRSTPGWSTPSQHQSRAARCAVQQLGSDWDPTGIRLGSGWDPAGIRLGSAIHADRCGFAHRLWVAHRVVKRRHRQLLPPAGACRRHRRHESGTIEGPVRAAPPVRLRQHGLSQDGNGVAALAGVSAWRYEQAETAVHDSPVRYQGCQGGECCAADGSGSPRAQAGTPEWA